MQPSVSIASSRTRLLAPLVVAAGALLAVVAGLAATGSFEALVSVAILAGASAWAWAWARPRNALWVLIPSTIFLVALPVTERTTVNLIDLLLLPALVGTWFWHRRPSWAADGSRADQAADWLVRAGWLYYGVAALSLARLALAGNPGGARDSLLLLARSAQGALIYFLVVRLIRDADGFRRVRNAVCAGLVLSLVVNAVWLALFGLRRAGAAWVLGPADVAIGDPNEAGSGILLVWVAALAIPFRRWLTILVLALSFALLLATQSRSGLLAWIVFCIAYGVRARRGWIWLAPGAVLALWPFLPEDVTGRLLRTIAFAPGSFEAYSSLVRIFSWRAAWAIFLQHPLLGVGYLGFRFVSVDFNPLRLVLGTAESFYLEVASGMGVAGLLCVVLFFAALHRMGRVARAVSPPGSWGDRLGRLTVPFLLGTAVANLTGDNLVGLLGVGQLALFAGLLTQAARLGQAQTAAAWRAT